eukprot:scaffold26647_cov115-Isochrysis_galbana.AAC.2
MLMRYNLQYAFCARAPSLPYPGVLLCFRCTIIAHDVPAQTCRRHTKLSSRPPAPRHPHPPPSSPISAAMLLITHDQNTGQSQSVLACAVVSRVENSFRQCAVVTVHQRLEVCNPRGEQGAARHRERERGVMRQLQRHKRERSSPGGRGLGGRRRDESKEGRVGRDAEQRKGDPAEAPGAPGAVAPQRVDVDQARVSLRELR